MKIAVISDIHGNMQALESVLDDIKKEKCEKIFCLGDLAMAGPEPIKTIELIKELYNNGNFELIQGNTDEMIGNFTLEVENKIKKAFPIMGNAIVDDTKIISTDLKSFLKTLSMQKELKIEGVRLLLVHGSPRRNDENIMPNLKINEIEEIISGTNADIIFCGHTHIPCGYQTTKKQTIVNAGSVGRPFTTKPQACYVIADFNTNTFNIMHKFIDYDNKKASKLLAQRNFVGADKLAEILIKPEIRHI